MHIDRKTRFDELPDIMTAEDCAACLGLHVKTIREYIQVGRLRAAKCGKYYRIRRDWVRDFLTKASM